MALTNHNVAFPPCGSKTCAILAAIFGIGRTQGEWVLVKSYDQPTWIAWLLILTFSAIPPVYRSQFYLFPSGVLHLIHKNIHKLVFFPSENHRDCWRWRISSAREIWLTWFAWHALYRTNPFRSERLARRSLYNVRDKPRRYEILQRKHFNSFYLFCMEWADDNFPLELTLNLTKVTLVKILTHLQNRMNQSYNNRQQNNNYISI